jgi:hypothetical protein
MYWLTPHTGHSLYLYPVVTYAKKKQSFDFPHSSFKMCTFYNPLKPKLVEIIFKNYVHTAKKAQPYHHYKDQFVTAV